jgi:hypothetical protein
LQKEIIKQNYKTLSPCTKNTKKKRRKGEDGEMGKKELGHRFTQMNTDKCN